MKEECRLRHQPRKTKPRSHGNEKRGIYRKENANVPHMQKNRAEGVRPGRGGVDVYDLRKMQHGKGGGGRQ